MVRYTKLAKHKLYLFEVVNGQWTQLDADDYDTGAQTQNLKIKANGTSLKVWYDGTLEFNVSDGTHAAGGVALAGYADSTFDNLKIGYDSNADDDLNDAGDDLVVNTDFSSTSTTFAYDDAGNLVDDGTFIYVYDAWNRLVQAAASEDDDVVVGRPCSLPRMGRRWGFL